eukprot:m.71498 g.71498  ORF g.71498 m.71498 type:complete len:71 (-) comp8711_c0_seq4:1319-1531(-)
MADGVTKEHVAYLASYKSVSTKLKKRFLRKNTVVDAVDHYQHLARQLEKEGVHQCVSSPMSLLLTPPLCL